MMLGVGAPWSHRSRNSRGAAGCHSKGGCSGFSRLISALRSSARTSPRRCAEPTAAGPAHSRLEIKLSVRARRREQEARDSRHSQRSTALRPHQQYSAHPVSTRLKARPPPFAIVPQTIPADFTTLVVRVSPLCVPTCIWCTKLGSHTTMSSQIRYTVSRR